MYDVACDPARSVTQKSQPIGIPGRERTRMNEIIQSLFDRKSIRAFRDLPVPEAERDMIIDAALQAPTAGNQALYTIIDVRDQAIKDALAVSCDNQPFIARAPLVLVFLADCRRWFDCYGYAGATRRKPGAGDLVLAMQDAMIAAQNAVTAAHSLGIGSCYIGDILENHDKVVELLKLDESVMPATLLVFGYPTESQRVRSKPPRFDRRFMVRQDTYSRQPEEDLRRMFDKRNGEGNDDRDKGASFDFDEYHQAFCTRKYMSDFALELNESVSRYLERFESR